LTGRNVSNETIDVERQPYHREPLRWQRTVRNQGGRYLASPGPCLPDTAQQPLRGWYPLLFRPDTQVRHEKQAPAGHPLQYWKPYSGHETASCNRRAFDGMGSGVSAMATGRSAAGTQHGL